MTPHQNIEAFWAGERPDRIPFTVGGALCGDWVRDPVMLGYFERGLVPTYKNLDDFQQNSGSKMICRNSCAHLAEMPLMAFPLKANLIEGFTVF